MNFAEAQAVLKATGVQFAPGLTAEEFADIERRFGFRFPPDLREFLTLGLPVSGGWVDWRGADESTLRKRLDWPADGVCFDIEPDAFWLAEWGPRPQKLADAFETARRAVASAPVLIPIFGHRYIPATPADRGNPIFSVYQTDIIYYGADLRDYFHNEFRDAFGRPQYEISGRPRRIEFWSKLAGDEGDEFQP